ncbi:Golgin candidate 6 [Glycine soja]|uniref:Golgin candidate 6 n=1 Tax=Glycine soja TaxID=3848 RepID=A0A0B2P3B6_GLYSO|nr:Golgin candidate 6 [Glycine soja]
MVVVIGQYGPYLPIPSYYDIRVPLLKKEVEYTKNLVIRNKALLLLTHLTREAKEIQKIVVFEGAFEKIFSIIREEGNSDGGVVDCLELLNNLLRSNASNQVLLRETVGLDSLILILKLRGSSFTFNQQKKKVLDHLLILRVESQCVPVLVRCAAMRCIGDLIAGDSKNRDLLASKVLGEEPHIEPTLNSILRILLRTSSMQEFIAIDYIFKSFCEVS